MYIKRVTADDDDIDVSAFASLKGVLLTPGSDAATAAIYDAAAVAGATPIIKVKAPSDASVYVPFDEDVVAKTAVSVDLTGTDPELYLFFE